MRSVKPDRALFPVGPVDDATLFIKPVIKPVSKPVSRTRRRRSATAEGQTAFEF